MHSNHPEFDPRREAQLQRKHLQRALTAVLAFLVLLGAVFFASEAWPPLRGFGVVPLEPAGLVGLIAAPLLHADIGHLVNNGGALLVLGTLLGTVYPRAAWRIVVVAWVGAGLFTWLLGRPSVHLGASGLTHGLFFALFALALWRRDTRSRTAAVIALLLFGGMAMSVLPGEWRISWEMHAGGALFGVLAAWRWRFLDPLPVRPPYSWEVEEDEAAAQREREASTLEPPRPNDVPVLWVRREEDRGVVLPFRRRSAPPE